MVDGDTVWLQVDLGFDTTKKDSFRLYGINAPETSTQAGKAAKAWLEALLPAGAEVVVRTYKDKREKYGRYLATILLARIDVNERLVAEGYAVPYDGGAR